MLKRPTGGDWLSWGVKGIEGGMSPCSGDYDACIPEPPRSKSLSLGFLRTNCPQESYGCGNRIVNRISIIVVVLPFFGFRAGFLLTMTPFAQFPGF